MISVLPKLICVGWGFVWFFSLVCLCFELILCAEGVCVLGLTLVILNPGGEKHGNYVALSVKFFITEIKKLCTN